MRKPRNVPNVGPRSDLIIALPAGWFLWSLGHIHTNIIYRDDVHTPIHWQAVLQHERGGRATAGIGPTPQDALDNACDQARFRSGLLLDLKDAMKPSRDDEC